MRILNQRGLTLMEILASMPLYIIVSGILSMAMVHFITVYQETRAYVMLQNQMMKSIETLRYGYTKPFVTDTKGILGLLSAKSCRIGYFSNNITLKPVNTAASAINANDYTRFWLDQSNGSLLTEGRYGVQTYTSEYVFPTDQTKVGQKFQYRLTKLEFSNQYPGGSSSNSKLLGIHMVGEVRYRERQPGQSAGQDKEFNVRSVDLNTQVYLGNVGNSDVTESD